MLGATSEEVTRTECLKNLGAPYADDRKKSFQAEGTACAETRRLVDRAWCVCGIGAA